MTDAALYREILKYEEQPDGTLMVYGLASDTGADLDQQGCDAEWLKTALPDWFAYGNVREMHEGIAAGVATELEVKGDDHYLRIHVVDPGSVKKVKNRVLKGISIGIRDARLIPDAAFRGGKIVGGWIPEVSLVDRPANPRCLLELTKTVGGAVLQVENLIEKRETAVNDCKECGKSAELNDDGLCAGCVAKAVGAEDAKPDESTGGDKPVDDKAVPAEGDEPAANTDADEGKAVDEPAGEDEAEEEAEAATLASISEKLDQLLTALGSKTEADKALEKRVGTVEKSVQKSPPARTATRTAPAPAEAEGIQTQYDELMKRAQDEDDPTLSRGLRARARELEPQLQKLS